MFKIKRAHDLRNHKRIVATLNFLIFFLPKYMPEGAENLLEDFSNDK